MQVMPLVAHLGISDKPRNFNFIDRRAFKYSTHDRIVDQVASRNVRAHGRSFLFVDLHSISLSLESEAVLTQEINEPFSWNFCRHARSR